MPATRNMIENPHETDAVAIPTDVIADLAFDAYENLSADERAEIVHVLSEVDTHTDTVRDEVLSTDLRDYVEDVYSSPAVGEHPADVTCTGRFPTYVDEHTRLTVEFDLYYSLDGSADIDLAVAAYEPTEGL